MFCNTIKDRREKKTLPLSPFHAGSFPGRVSPLDLVCMNTSSFYQGTALHYHIIKALLLYILDTYTYYQGTTIYIVYIHIINTLLYMNKLFQFIHIMKFF